MVFVFSSLLFPLEAGSVNEKAPKVYKEGEVLVKYKGQPPAILQKIGTIKTTFPDLNIRKLILKKGASVPEAIKELEADPNVEYAEPNYIIHALMTPNDKFFGQQWYMPKISAPDAWNISTGSSSVIIAVLDTGLDYNHPDLAQNVWSNPGEIPGNGIDDDKNGLIDDVRGWDFINNTNDPMDDEGHGTAVSGLIGAVGNNGKGIAGLMFTAKLMPLKVMDFTGSGDVGAVISAIQYAMQKGANIANCSFGFTGKPSKALQDAIAGAPNILFSCASGNEKSNDDASPEFPASYDNANIISVASTGKSDQLSSFSNFGAGSVDLAAPGEDIFSTEIIRDGVFADGFSQMNWTANPPGSWGLSSAPGTFLSPPSSLGENPVQAFQPNTVTSPMISLAGRHACILNYELDLSIPQDEFFYAEASPDGGASWALVDQASGNINTFNDNSIIGVSLEGFSGLNILIRFRLQAGSGFVFIDDLNVNCASVQYDGEHEYDDGLNGTSFSAPLVSGTAGLLKTVFPSLSAVDLRTLILGGVDVIPGLNGLVASSGRLNVARSFLPPAPANFTASGPSGSAALSWTDDPNEDSYTLEKAAAGGAFAPLAVLPANSTSYSDTSVQNGTTYVYRIKASNSFGDSGYVESAPVTPGTSGSGKGGGGGGGCFIATAAFGSPLADEVITLRKFRDEFLLKNALGRSFVEFYYEYSPTLAGLIKKNESLRAATRSFLYSVVYSIKYPAWAGFFILCACALGIRARKIVKYYAVSKSAGKKGFTLLEILIVVAILSILATIVAPKIIGRTDDAKVADAKVQIRNLETALKLFKLDNSFFPSTEQGLQALVEKPATGKIPSRYREGGYLEQHRVPADPWGNPFVYISPGTNGDYDLSSLGADGKEGGEGYDKDIKSWELE